MHTCQILLVEANDVNEAFSKVENEVDSYGAEWSDWHNASNAHTLNFAGRWEGQVFCSLDETGSPTTDSAPNFLRYSDDPALAEQVLTQWIEERLNVIGNLKSQAIDPRGYEYNIYKEDTFSMEIYATKKLVQLIDDEWNCDSGVYDLESRTASLQNFIKRVSDNPSKQWLIPVDFHF